MTTISTSQINTRLTGIGWVNASGSGRGRDDQASGWPDGTPAVQATILKSLKGGSRFGRLDLFSQIGVAAIGLALQDAGKLEATVTKTKKTGSQTYHIQPAIGLICATTSSCSLTDANFYNTVKEDPHLASPGLFVYTLATSFLGEAALRFSLTGSSMAIIEPQPNATEAICLAIEELTTGDDEIIVAGLCNLFADNYHPMQISGALFLVLEKEAENRAQSNNKTYATLSCDPQTNILYCNNQPCPDIFSLQKIVCG